MCCRSPREHVHASLRLGSPHALRGCWRACGISYGAAAAAAALVALPFGSSGVLLIASLTHRFNSAVLTRSLAAGVCAASAIVAVAVTATLVALPPGSFGVLGSYRSRIATAQQSSRAAWLLACVASALVAVAATAVFGGAAFGQLWRFVDRIAHASLRLSSPHVLRDCGRACGISYRRCCRDCHFGGAAFRKLWRPRDRLAHASLQFSSPHARRGCRRARGISYGAVAVTAASAALHFGSFDVLGNAPLTHRYGSAVLTRGLAADVRVASAMGAAAVIATLVALPPCSFGVLRILPLAHR